MNLFLNHEFVKEWRESHPATFDDLGDKTLVKSSSTLIYVNFLHAIDRTRIEKIFTARLHHKSSSDGIKGVRYNMSTVADEFTEQIIANYIILRTIREEYGPTSIKETEIKGSVENDTNN